MKCLYNDRLKISTICAAKHQLGYPPFSAFQLVPYCKEEPFCAFVQIPLSGMLSLDYFE